MTTCQIELFMLLCCGYIPLGYQTCTNKQYFLGNTTPNSGKYYIYMYNTCTKSSVCRDVPDIWKSL